MPDIIKPKRATKSVADKSDKVLEKDELLLISPNTGSGTGRYGVKIGDGATATKDLPYAIDGEKADEMIVSEFTKESNENPVLSPGDKIKTLCGKLLKKFTYIETLLGKKVNTSDIYDGTDSSSTTKVATANSVRQVNEKADNNASQINQLNSKFVENTNWDKKLKLSLSVEDGGAKRLIIVENDKWIGDINLTNIAPISVE